LIGISTRLDRWTRAASIPPETSPDPGERVLGTTGGAPGRAAALQGIPDRGPVRGCLRGCHSACDELRSTPKRYEGHALRGHQACARSCARPRHYRLALKVRLTTRIGDSVQCVGVGEEAAEWIAGTPALILGRPKERVVQSLCSGTDCMQRLITIRVSVRGLGILRCRRSPICPQRPTGRPLSSN
jgi:hypothetical protein